MNHRNNHLLPRQIHAVWLERLKESELQDAHAQAILSVMRSYLPPLSIQALMISAQHYALDWQPSWPTPPLAINTDTLVAAGERLALPDTLPRRLATQHPLFYGTTRIFNDLTNPGHRAARRVLVGLFRSAALQGAQAPTYYVDVRETRDCLRWVVDAAGAETPHWRENARCFRDALAALDINPAAHPGDYRKRERFRALVDGDRAVGVPLAKQPSGIRRHTQYDPRDAEFRARLSRTQSGAAAQREQSLQREEGRADPSEIRIGGAVYYPASPAKRASADADAPDYLERRTHSALSPADDRALLRHAARIAPTAGLSAQTDVHRLPIGRVAEALEAVATSEVAWAFAWLTLTTGMPYTRLERLTVTSAPPEGEIPHWNPATQTLCYRLLDGPVAVDRGDNLIISLRLPEPVQAALRTTRSPTPFAQQRRFIDEQLRRVHRNTPGMAASLARLRASAILWTERNACDSVAARALSGVFSLGLAAQAAYRQYRPGELQRLFERTCTSLAEALAPFASAGGALSRRLAAMHFPAGPDLMAGSGRARSPRAYREIFEALATKVGDAGQRCQRPGAQVSTLLEALRWQAGYAHLAWLLGSGARPVAQKTVFVRQQQAAFLADKASDSYRERRLIPIIHPLAQQLDEVHESGRIIEHALTRRGLRVRDSRPQDQRALPAFLMLRSPRLAEWHVCRQRDLALMLAQCSLGHLEPRASNATRHTVASTLRQVLPEDQVSALLGHVRLGMHLFAPASSAAAMDWGALRTALAGLLEEAGFQLTRIPGIRNVY